MNVLHRHRRITQPLAGTKLTQQQYQSTQRVCYLDDLNIGLFKTYDAENHEYRFSWDRCQFALARKVKIEYEHKDGCKGFAGAGANSFIGRLMRLCDCPMTAVGRNFVWLVDPRDKEASWKNKTGTEIQIIHGVEHVSPLDHE